MSWEEAQRISTAVVVISDEREDWSTFRSKNKDKQQPSKGTPTGARDLLSGKQGDTPTLTVDDYRRELATNRTGLDKARKTLQAHRRALLDNSLEGRLDPHTVTFFERVESIHRDKVEGIEALLLELGAEPVSD